MPKNQEDALARAVHELLASEVMHEFGSGFTLDYDVAAMRRVLNLASHRRAIVFEFPSKGLSLAFNRSPAMHIINDLHKHGRLRATTCCLRWAYSSMSQPLPLCCLVISGNDAGRSFSYSFKVYQWFGSPRELRVR